MANPAKRKGDKAELEAQGLLRDLLGLPVRRKLGAGRQDDQGDLDGLPDCVVQVANYQDVARAIREKLPEVETQRQRAGVNFSALFIRRRGGGFVVCMSPEMFATFYREAVDLNAKGLAA